MDTLSTCATYQEHIHSTYVTHRSQHIRHTGDQQDRTIRTTTAKEATKAKRHSAPVELRKGQLLITHALLGHYRTEPH